MNLRTFHPLVGLTTFVVLLGVTLIVHAENKITFDEHIQPIFREKCAACHNLDKKSGDLDVTNYTNLMLGGGSGEVIEPGDASSSYLYQLITHESEPFMPLDTPKIPDEMVETIRKWIDGGVLENRGSKARVQKKKSTDFALSAPSAGRPDVVSIPPRLSLEPVVTTKVTTAISTLATSPWAPLVAVGGQKQVLLYDTQTLELIGMLPFPEGIPQVLKFSRNGSLLLAGGGRQGANGKVVVWNIKTGERAFELGDELDTVLAADISSDQTLVALGGPGRVVRIYSVETGELEHELRKHTDWIRSVEFSPDSVLLATGDRNGGLVVWEGWTGREYLTLNGHGSAVMDVSWRSDSNVLASCSEDGSIRLWEMENGGQIKNWGAHGGVASLEFARDGRILSCGRDRVTRLWDQNGSQQREFEAFDDLALRVTFCDESNRAIAGDWNGLVRIWDATEGTRLGELNVNPPTLVQRLQTSNTILEQTTAAHKSAESAAVVAAELLGKLKEQLAQSDKTVADANARLEILKQQTVANRQKIVAANKQNETAGEEVQSLETVVPVLNEAAEKAKLAATKLPEDKELAEQTATLSRIAEQRATSLQEARAVMAESEQVVKTLESTLVETETEVATVQDQLKQAMQSIEVLKPKLVDTETASTESKKVAKDKEAELADSQQQVGRWNEELAFTEHLSELTKIRTHFEEELLQREDEQFELEDAAKQTRLAFDELKAQSESSRSALAEAQQSMETIGKKMSAMEKSISDNETDLGCLVKAVEVEEGIVQLVRQALDKATTAAADNPYLVAVMEELTATSQQQSQQLATLRDGVTSGKQGIEQSRVQFEELQHQLAQVGERRDQEKARVDELVESLESARQADQSAEANVAEVKVQVEQTLSQLSQVLHDLAVARGLVNPADDSKTAAR